MNNAKARNSTLGLTALLALTLYILACTSFSPDDKKILYPAFDSASGQIGIAVYDRETRKSNMLLVPMGTAGDLVRGGWMPDGRQALVFWGERDNSGPVNLALVPVGANGPVKIFQTPDIKDRATLFVYGLGLLDRRVFLVADSNRVVRLNLATGGIDSREVPGATNNFCILPSPGGFLLYTRKDSDDSGVVLGRMNPDTCALTPVLTATNQPRENSFLAYNDDATALAFVEEAGGADRLVVVRQGKPAFTRPLNLGTSVSFGSAGFFAKGDALWATFARKNEDRKKSACGFMEIPLGAAPVRETVLLTNAPPDEASALYTQGAVSHDGRMAAIASTYLAKEEVDPDLCALFLIDLGDANRKVTRVSVPTPVVPAEPARKGP